MRWLVAGVRGNRARVAQIVGKSPPRAARSARERPLPPARLRLEGQHGAEPGHLRRRDGREGFVGCMVVVGLLQDGEFILELSF